MQLSALKPTIPTLVDERHTLTVTDAFHKQRLERKSELLLKPSPEEKKMIDFCIQTLDAEYYTPFSTIFWTTPQRCPFQPQCSSHIYQYGLLSLWQSRFLRFSSGESLSLATQVLYLGRKSNLYYGTVPPDNVSFAILRPRHTVLILREAKQIQSENRRKIAPFNLNLRCVPDLFPINCVSPGSLQYQTHSIFLHQQYRSI